MLFDNFCASMVSTYKLLPPVSSMNYTDEDIVCCDNDGDGYYYWGVGPRPASSPSWVREEPDGDDADINLGPMDDYGRLINLPEGITVRDSTVYTGNYDVDFFLGIVNQGQLVLKGNHTFTENGKIRVCEGGTLIVDGGYLYDADIEFIPGSSLIVRNNGHIYMSAGMPFSAAKGVYIKIESGEIH